jgi:hypothetical protein
LVARGPKDRSRKYRVGVFTFGNAEGRYTLGLGDNGPILRGALTDALRAYLDKHAPGKFTVLYPEQVDEEIAASTTDPRGISGKSLDLARKLLKAYDLQVGIVGRFGLRSVTKLRSDFGAEVKRLGSTGVPLSVQAILSSDVVPVESSVRPREVVKLGFVPVESGYVLHWGRLAVRFFVKLDDRASDDDDGAWKLIPLRTPTGRNTDGLFYLVVPKSYKGKRYKIVLVNTGRAQWYSNDKGRDPDRLFSACVLVDGVSTFMRKDGTQYRHVSGYPADLPKWILSPRGKRLVPDREGMKGRIRGAKLVPARGAGGAEVHILGFQKGSDVAGSFVFATAAESVAAPELLSLRKIGTISVYFYSESLADDTVYFSSGGGGGGGRAGTSMGKQVPSPTFPVLMLDMDGLTIVYNILYRCEGDPSIPANLKPIKEAE